MRRQCFVDRDFASQYGAEFALQKQTIWYAPSDFSSGQPAPLEHYRFPNSQQPHCDLQLGR